jgi:hypothetical protein
MVNSILYNNVPPAVQKLFHNTDELLFFNSNKHSVITPFNEQINNLALGMPQLLKVKDNKTWSEY